ncbi:CPBP family intramembrane metalloprotease [Donghicola sp. C2-DW-16]|uniref:CPBP family intramembrane metalloprotease n=1 Tax=Donghicola mangrovi TaxID=2729614 RepID=A0ABX2PAH1_9RHOB|nr:type II CAAX endopeptidase family protein [Donghicola mangrovi]NVO26373.1 CPBP family intramembrane metalloprotease [Donghicola mangrovi]
MKFPSAYAAHDSLAAPAKTHPEGWRFALGMVVMLVAGYGIMSTYWAFVQTIAGGQAPALLQDAEEGASPIGMILLLIGFGSMAAGLALSTQHIHKRAFASLFGPTDLAWAQFKQVALPVAGISLLIAILPPWGGTHELQPHLTLGTWLTLLPLSLLAVGIQVATEEVVFRGYLQQHLSVINRDPRVWIGLPALLFALGHYSPATAGPNAVPLALWAGAFALAMADLTARSGTLGPAIAVHFVNNVFAMVIISYQGDLSGLALFTLPMSMDDAEPVRAALPVDIMMLLVTWLAARLALRR